MGNLDVLFEAPIFAVQLLIDGLLIGAIFALVAYGMALVWGVMNVINIAQGEFVVLGGYMVVICADDLGLSPFLGVPLGALVGFLLGWLVYGLVVRRVVDHDLFISILATFGVSILIAQSLNQVFGPDERSFDPGLGSIYMFDNVVTISIIKVVALVAAFAIGGALLLFLRHARLGQAIRATAQNPRAARVMGIDTDRVFAMTYAVNAAICGAAGALVAMTWVIGPYAGLPYTVRAFMIVIVAGLGNLGSVILAGLGLGVAEHFANFIFGAEAQLAFVFSLLVVILIARNLMLRRRRMVLR
ncbi:MAG TPA: branched-chain amino acid ABC transporter permease [Alphaproteobacteria bacterium]